MWWAPAQTWLAWCQVFGSSLRGVYSPCPGVSTRVFPSVGVDRTSPRTSPWTDGPRRVVGEDAWSSHSCKHRHRLCLKSSSTTHLGTRKLGEGHSSICFMLSPLAAHSHISIQRVYVKFNYSLKWTLQAFMRKIRSSHCKKMISLHKNGIKRVITLKWFPKQDFLLSNFRKNPEKYSEKSENHFWQNPVSLKTNQKKPAMVPVPLLA